LPKEDNINQGLLKGIPVSEGIAIGKVQIMESPWDEVVEQRIKKSEVNKEIERYEQALIHVVQQLAECRDRVKIEIGDEEARIFEAHLAILKDPFFQEEIPASIEKVKRNTEYLLKIGIDKLNRSFQKIKSDYFRHRIDDIRDVGMRILKNLLQSKEVKFPSKIPVILLSHTLTPSDTARIDRTKILGFATELGGETSHASILARAMGIPAVVGVDKLMKEAHSECAAIVDGNAGIVYIDPPHDVLSSYKKRQKQYATYQKLLSGEASLPAITADGVEISLQANVSMTADMSLAASYKADGIGLFRTELPFLSAGRILSEQEQFTIYKTAVETMKGKMVTIRTLDLGGDKFLPFQDIEEERNPFLGWRSIRISLQERDIFKIQLRAIIRASAFGKVRVLFPMISSLGEVIEIKEVLEETKQDLTAEGIPYDKKMEMGIMIEVPSAAILANRLTSHVQHFSIGTNDLIQYTLAVDRNNEKVAKFYQPLNPAILNLIHQTITAADRSGISVSLCGEMAGNPLYTSLLLGFGLRQFSMSPLMLPEVKERIRAITISECKEVAENVLGLASVPEIEKVLWDFHFKANKKQSIPYMDKKERAPIP